jgi:hypothetical protein
MGEKKMQFYGSEFWCIFADRFLWTRWKLVIYVRFVEIFLLIELAFERGARFIINALCSVLHITDWDEGVQLEFVWNHSNEWLS